MGIFRYADKYAAPTREQRERYMTGKSEEHRFGPEGQIMLIEYHEAAYLKDDIDNIRILSPGSRTNRRPAKRQNGWQSITSTKRLTKPVYERTRDRRYYRVCRS